MACTERFVFFFVCKERGYVFRVRKLCRIGMLCSLKELGLTAEHDYPYAVITPAALLNDYHPLEKDKPSIPADIQPGDKVLITGCGIIASMVARWAKYRGASYIAMTEISEVKIAKAEEIGTPAQFFHAADPDLVDKLLAASDGGFDKAVDCPGNAATLNLTLDVTRPLGIIVEAAIHYKPVEFNYLKLVMKRLTLRGFYLSSPYFKEVIRIMSEEAPFDHTVFVSEEIDIDGIPDAVERLSAPDSDLLKVVIHP